MFNEQIIPLVNTSWKTSISETGGPRSLLAGGKTHIRLGTNLMAFVPASWAMLWEEEDGVRYGWRSSLDNRLGIMESNVSSAIVRHNLVMLGSKASVQVLLRPRMVHRCHQQTATTSLQMTDRMGLAWVHCDFVDQANDGMITITRHNRISSKLVLLIPGTA